MISYLGGKRAYLFFPAGIYSVTGLIVTTNMSLEGLIDTRLHYSCGLVAIKTCLVGI